MKGTNKTVFVGLSGGVDSSVSAYKLLQQGYRVVGVFIKTWYPDFLVCNWEKERLDAMRVAAQLGIPFLTCDAEARYKQDVAEYMIEEYKNGRTPNPDVMCNRHVKFGAFLDFAQAYGADYIATGHYAQVSTHADGTHHLLRGVDSSKDQSYFLWTLTESQLAYTLFPIGNMLKVDVRKMALAASLVTSTKPDSQGVCFLGAIQMDEFLAHYIETKPGAVCTMDGVVIGTHKGALLYTIGQRHGFTIQREGVRKDAQYVIAKDLNKNILFIGERPKVTAHDTFTLHSVVFRDNSPSTCLAQFRYRQTPVPIHVVSRKDDRLTLTLSNDTQLEQPAIGQSCVLYDHDRCIGGGILSDNMQV
jgi:tRNA-uridine 2-sulfurtransferase